MRSPPPRDQNGKIVPHNHREILDSHHVVRHILPQDLYSEPSGKVRVQSGAYSESSDGGMSVDIIEWMVEDGLSELHYLTDPSQGAVKLSVASLRREGFLVGWDPDGGHPHHGAVWGIGNGSTRRRRIARLAVTLRKAKGET